MRARFHILALSLLCALAADRASAQGFEIKLPSEVFPPGGAPGRVIVKVSREAYGAAVSPTMFGALTERYGIHRMESWLSPDLLGLHQPRFKMGSGIETPERNLLRIMTVEYTSSHAPEEVALALAHAPGVEYAEPIYPGRLSFNPNDPDAFRQWYLDIVGAKEAWDIVRADSSITIAIIDAGVDRLHPDLANAIWYNPGESGTDGGGADRRTNGVDDDGNGFVDDFWGYDFAGTSGFTQDPDPSPEQNTHGTHVAGIAAASGNNGAGVVGIAFGARVMAVKVASRGPDPDIFNGGKAIVYAAQMGAKVINCSWGSSAFSRADREAVNYVTKVRKAIIIAAAGNDDNTQLRYPATYPGVLSVANIDNFDRRGKQSNYNYRIDLSAPGEFIYSTMPNATYGYMAGTSMASPVVSGGAALLMLRYPELRENPEKLHEVLRATTEDISVALGPTYADRMGTGRLNIVRALREAETVASARMVAYRTIDGNRDSILDPGEEVVVVADIRNVLAASNVSASLACISHPTTTIIEPMANLGALASGQTVSTPETVFHVQLPPGLEPNTELLFKLTLTTSDRTTNEYITLRVAPTYLTTDLNRIATTFNSVGNVGYNGINRRQGDGFSVGASKNLLYHGGLMIGVSAERLSDVVRIGRTADGTSDGFRMIEPYRLSNPGPNVEIGRARFSDAHREPGARVGVEVDMTTHEFTGATDENIVLVTYKIRNTSGAPLENLHCGLYLDWDIGIDGYNDQTTYDPEYRMGFARNILDQTLPQVGAALLTGQSVDYFAIENSDPDIAPTSDFTPERKWRVLSSGIGNENVSDADISMVMGAGGITLQPDQTTTVAFALLGGSDFAALRAAATRAGVLYQQVSAVPGAPRVELIPAQALPNPFSASTTIAFDMPSFGDATLAIYTVRGELVSRRTLAELPAGAAQIRVEGADVPDGVYIYELITPAGISRGRLVKIAQ